MNQLPRPAPRQLLTPAQRSGHRQEWRRPHPSDPLKTTNRTRRSTPTTSNHAHASHPLLGSSALVDPTALLVSIRDVVSTEPASRLTLALDVDFAFDVPMSKKLPLLVHLSGPVLRGAPAGTVALHR